jgi:hypothetical protein
MDPRIDVRGRIAELLTTARRPPVGSHNEPALTAAAPAPEHHPGRVRVAIGDALIGAGHAFRGEARTRTW